MWHARAACLFDVAGGASLTLQNVTLSGFAAGKPQEACIKAALMRAHVDPFSDPTFSVPVPIRP